MKAIIAATLSAGLFSSSAVLAHTWKAGDAADKEVMRQHILEEWMQQHAVTEGGEIKPVQVAAAAPNVNLAAAAAANAANAPAAAKPFLAFPRVELKWDKDFLFVGSNGLPDHNMMVGITAWQQQVPLPQNTRETMHGAFLCTRCLLKLPPLWRDISCEGPSRSV